MAKRKRGDHTIQPAQAPGDRADEGPPFQATGVEPFSSATVEALQVYFHDVKEYFKGDEPKYAQFMTLLDARNNLRTLDNRSVIAQIKGLFKDHREMLVRFNEVLPQESKVILPPTALPEEYPQLVAAFLEKIKARLNGGIYYDSIVHEMFKLRSGFMYIREELTALDLLRLLQDNSDLLEDFALVARSQPAQIAPARAIPIRIPSSGIGETDIVNEPLVSGKRCWEAGEGPSERKEQPPKPVPPRNDREAKTNVPGEGASSGKEVDLAAQQLPSSERTREQPPGIHSATAKRLYEYLKVLLDVYWENGKQNPPRVAEFLSEEQMRCFREFYGDEADFVLRRLSKHPIDELPKVLTEVRQQKKRDIKGKAVRREIIVIDE